jgi:hypothetical protein
MEKESGVSGAFIAGFAAAIASPCHEEGFMVELEPERDKRSVKDRQHKLPAGQEFSLPAASPTSNKDRLCKLGAAVLVNFSKSMVFYLRIKGFNRDFGRTYSAKAD